MYEEFLKNTPLSPGNAVDLLREPLSAFKLRHANWFIKRRLCFSYRDLLKHGAKWIGQEQRDAYVKAIDEHDLKVQLIIAGFLGDAPVLYETRGNGQQLNLEPVTNFCLIGSGSYTAEPALHARTQTATTALSQAVYNVYEAKRCGEASPFVGTKTRLLILSPPDQGSKQLNVEVLTDEGERWLRGLYRRFGPKAMRREPGIPAAALQDGTYFLKNNLPVRKIRH
jgi:hypothetical protein